MPLRLKKQAGDGKYANRKQFPGRQSVIFTLIFYDMLSG